MAVDRGAEMKRLIISPEAVLDNRIHITDNEDIAYLSVVLRMKENDGLLVSDGMGKSWETIVDIISRDRIELKSYLKNQCIWKTKRR